MERVCFGRRARRRARLKRWALIGSMASVIALVLHVPGFDAGLRFVDSLEDGGLATRAGGAGSVARSRLRFNMLEGLRKRTSGSGTARSAHNAGDASRDGRKPRQHPPPPSPQSPPPQREPSIERIVASAAGEYEVDADYLLSIAACESGLDPTAVNAAGYHGLFQFDRETWSAYGYGDIYNPVAQARTAAALLAAGHSSRWPNCS